MPAVCRKRTEKPEGWKFVLFSHPLPKFYLTKYVLSYNINVLVNEIGFSDEPNLDNYTAYALIHIVSPRPEKDVRMGVGSDDAVKVWLNGEVVWVNNVDRGTTGITDFFNADFLCGFKEERV